MTAPPPTPHAAGRVYSSGIAGLAVICSIVVASCSGSGSQATVAKTTPDGSTTNPPPTNPTPPATASLIFGVQTHFGQGWPVTFMPRVAAANVADVRDELYWELVEPTPGNYTFPALFDSNMAALRDRNITPLVELDFENHNYDGGQTPFTDSGFAAYGRYAVALLRHYGTQIKAVEVWNEYNGAFVKGPAADDRAGTYVRMLKVAYAAIKAERPDVTVVAGATAGVPLPYFEKLFAAGALDSLDAVSIHPYRDEPPEGIEIQVATLRALMARYGSTKPIWVTEVGWGTHPPAAPGDLNLDEATQANYLVRACALLVSAGVKQIYWYQFRDDASEGMMGLVRNDDAATSKHSFSAMATLNTQLRYATFVARESTADGVYSLRFNSGGELRVLWALSPTTVQIPAGTRVTDAMGAAVSTSSGSITVTDSPVYVAGPLATLAGAATARAESAITDSAAAFSLQQGNYGWYYGYFTGTSATFQPLLNTRITDWKEEWIDRFPSISISETDQHPSFGDGQQVAVVRRWISTVNGDVRVTAHFKVGLQGDGVRVRVLADGQPLYSATLGGGQSIVGDFTARRTVQAGSIFDFAVDPGAAGNIDYDATTVSVTVERASP
ncbi:MAG TPA: hypothetical protein VFJ90_02490 [Candidatus Didemnitutus sp.]|nr:hypothetical protein [Candidatus Didemnitutus sp.]